MKSQLHTYNRNQSFNWLGCLFFLFILGVVGAIIAPSFLNQANKAKQSEAKQYIGSMNRAQQAYSLDKSGIPDTSNLEPKSNTEEYNDIEDNSFQRARIAPLSTFAIDVDTASYSNVRRFINEGTLPPKDAVRIEELINYFSYDYPQPERDRPFSITTEISTAPWNSTHKLVHIGLQGKKISKEDLPPSNLVFLLDVSGSMADANKLPLLKSAFQLLVNQLTEKDRVSIVVYTGSAGVVLPPTSGSDKAKILAAIDRLEAGGSTAGGEGIQKAYQLAQQSFIPSGNNRVILATDGDFNVGISSDNELVKLIETYRDRDIFLTVLGCGMGNLKDAKMEQLADKGNGNYAYIDNLNEAKKVLVSQMSGTLLTIAKDVKVQVEFNPAQVQAYRLIGYENRLLESQDFNDDRKDAGELGAGHSVTALYEVIPVGVKSDVNLPDINQLRSQQKSSNFSSSSNNELMLVKLRYKAPNSTTSQMITQPVVDGKVKLEDTSNNFKLAAAVAEFGMILQESEYRGNANFEQVLKLAEQSQGADLQGYRSEFIRLVEKSKNLEKAETPESSTFANNITDLGLGIRSETANYRYSIRKVGNTVFNYAIPRKEMMKAYVGVVWFTSSNQNSEALMCEATSPGAIKPADPIFQNGGFICAPGTKDLR
jgi:Ca-activated chloride channel family protein